MEIVMECFDLFVNLDEHLNAFFLNYGNVFYWILFLVIFCETGLVIAPFLPGDSLLFAVGSLAAISSIKLPVVLFIVTAAAIIGDSVNYSIGRLVGPKIFRSKSSKLFNVKNLEKAHAFYDKHGGNALILCRFVPILRTFVPFVSGIAAMNFSKFVLFNVIGGVLWAFLFILSGFFFGNIPFVKERFEYVVLGIILFSLVPVAWELFKNRAKTAHELKR